MSFWLPLATDDKSSSAIIWDQQLWSQLVMPAGQHLQVYSAGSEEVTGGL